MSAYVIDNDTYNKFYNAIATMWDDTPTFNVVQHPIEWFFRSINQQPKDPVKTFVAKMWALNIASVNYRYLEDPNTTPDEDAHESLLKRNMRGRFPILGIDSTNPQHLQEMGGFICCWHYQSCEIPENRMTPEQHEIMDTALALKSAFYEKGLRLALHREGSWGDLDFGKPSNTVMIA